jgi:protein TonB
MRREAFVPNDVPRWRVMPVGVSCLLHVGLVAGLVLGQQWVLTVVAVRPPVLPVQLVTLEAPAEPAQPATLEDPAPQPAAATPPPAEIVPVPASPPSVSEPAIGPAPISSTPAAPTSLAPTPPAVAKASSTGPDGITQTARPQGGYQVRPAYPAAPRRLGIQGTVLLRVHVLADGRIGDILVERSAGHHDLDHAAAEAVRGWRFEPARRGADAIAMWVLLPVEFRLTP